MPELPEVETVRTRLEPVLVGRTLAEVEIRDGRLVRPRDPREVAAELTGDTVTAVARRGKYLLIRLASGRALVVHLRMTGAFLTGEDAEAPHTRALLRLDDGARVAYRDVRRFGTWELVEDEAALHAYLGRRLGEEPLAPRFTTATLAARLEGRRAPVKAALLDQRSLAGMGNIYVDEALWRARINPRRPAGALEEGELRALHRAVRAALRRGIERQGATLRDYRTPDGGSGSMQHEFHVYGRAGEPCDRCGREIVKTRVAGRGTWFCPRCQPESG